MAPVTKRAPRTYKCPGCDVTFDKVGDRALHRLMAEESSECKLDGNLNSKTASSMRVAAMKMKRPHLYAHYQIRRSLGRSLKKVDFRDRSTKTKLYCNVQHPLGVTNFKSNMDDLHGELEDLYYNVTSVDNLYTLVTRCPEEHLFAFIEQIPNTAPLMIISCDCKASSCGDDTDHFHILLKSLYKQKTLYEKLSTDPLTTNGQLREVKSFTHFLGIVQYFATVNHIKFNCVSNPIYNVNKMEECEMTDVSFHAYKHTPVYGADVLKKLYCNAKQYPEGYEMSMMMKSEFPEYNDLFQRGHYQGEISKVSTEVEGECTIVEEPGRVTDLFPNSPDIQLKPLDLHREIQTLRRYDKRIDDTPFLNNPVHYNTNSGPTVRESTITDFFN